jgi:hypothetical protein
MCVPVAAKAKSQENSQDPYATAEFETAPAVDAADLTYRTIPFEDFTVPAEWVVGQFEITALSANVMNS